MKEIAPSRLCSVYYPCNTSYTIGDTIKAKEDFPIDVVDALCLLSKEVVHSYNSLLRAHLGRLAIAFWEPDYNYAIVQCVIPANIPFWKDDNDDIVGSKELKIISIIT